MREPLLNIEDLEVHFKVYGGFLRVLNGVNFQVFPSEKVGLVGETGCGKSVTANCILRLIPMPPGKIEKGMIYFAMPKEKAEAVAGALGETHKAGFRYPVLTDLRHRPELPPFLKIPENG